MFDSPGALWRITSGSAVDAGAGLSWCSGNKCCQVWVAWQLSFLHLKPYIETGFIFLFLVSAYEVPFKYW